MLSKMIVLSIKELDVKHINIEKGLKNLVTQKLFLKIINNFFIEYQNFDTSNMNLEEMKLAFHTIKGLSANIGATNLSKYSLELEVSFSEDLLKEFNNELNLVLKDIEKIISLSNN
jgi:HPt (histidine-containing phosphotransfer) domain-containing protein